ncbi:MAG: SGNH/GDSL hydrolase family protein [Candidatus Izemoplasmatales bacterium]|nr:SGNH/GDSL hydrolase family protein [Candidatus Izemoplasmatales bacterium]MDD3865859.1 SGNH/GDSL hydrolase family protein [Candidatus Izemoplasmatales bacterium]
MKTVVFGDSIAKGIVTDDGTIKAINNNTIAIVADFFKKEIKSVSQYGQTVKRLMEKKTINRYLESLDPKEEQYAVLALGGNDADYDWVEVGKTPNEDHPSKTPIEEFILLYTEMIQLLQNHGVHVIVLTIFPIESKLFFKNVISKMTDPEAIIQFMNGDIDNISRRQEGFNVAVIKCAYENHCKIIDIRSKILFERDYKQFICHDGIHPNEAGYRLLANIIIEDISNSSDLIGWIKATD